MPAKKPRNQTIYIHFNKPGAPKGFPWTVHTSKACIPAKEVLIKVATETVWKPERKTNPRAFIKAMGRVHHAEDGRVIIHEAGEPQE